MNAVWRIGVLSVAGILASCVSASEPAGIERDLRLSLSVSIKETKKERVPVFTVRIRNASNSPVVVLDPRRYVPSIFIDVSPSPLMSICDPATPRKDEYVTLNPGEVLEADINADRLCFGPWSSGKYEAYAEYGNWNYWLNISDTYRSNAVSFVITN